MPAGKTVDKKLSERTKICSNILEAVGHTPLVELRKIPKTENIKCRMLVKCEFTNPGGSVKDRIACRMIAEAEAKGILKPGSVIIEPTSGNTGIGLAMACAVKGYRCIIVLPDKMSDEKVTTLRLLGAEVVRTLSEVPLDHPESMLPVAERLVKEIPNAVILDQFRNKDNPMAHYESTGAEILWQCDGKVDMFVMGAGTGGTVSGVGQRLKESNSKCTVVCADPFGSILAQPDTLNKTDVKFFEMEGIGYFFIPPVLRYKYVDKWIKVNDKDSFLMARRLNLEEGLLCGGSSGAIMHAAIQAAKQLRADQTCVVMLPDGIRNYLSKFVTENWMEARGFIEPTNTCKTWWWNRKVNELNLIVPKTFPTEATCWEILNFMKTNNLDVVPAVMNDGVLLGGITYKSLTSQVVSQNMQASDPIQKAVYKKSIKIDNDTNLGKIGRILESEPYVFILSDKKELIGVVTQKIFLDFVLKERN